MDVDDDYGYVDDEVKPKKPHQMMIFSTLEKAQDKISVMRFQSLYTDADIKKLTNYHGDSFAIRLKIFDEYWGNTLEEEDIVLSIDNRPVLVMDCEDSYSQKPL